MKNLKKIPVKFSQAETTPDGINLVRITEAGWSVHVKLVGWKTVIRWLDEGHYDHDLADGVILIAALQDGKARGYVRLTDEQETVIWRWLVTCLFIGEQQKKNGVAEIANGEGGTDLATIYSGKYGALSVYPAAVRVSLAVNVEGVALEKYGSEEGLKLAIRMYREMTDDGGEMSLSAFGREMFTKLHDETVWMIQNGWTPDTPVMH
ncbi:hypothetical protein RLV03_003242 [Salmonella enterica subsp. enterica serovar Benin]|nr:hypothetical protein [Salmonella enterica]ELD8110428.1 hypothetical protein [Salmonella enterica subsp. enterica serovar Benin]EBE7296588.1 hypothetical protein [Salmonella enterica]EHB9442786.1 hypothetical protein [Salmonella enterica]EHT6840674.1 hypothetical protein [Salmonella enterica]